MSRARHTAPVCALAACLALAACGGGSSEEERATPSARAGGGSLGPLPATPTPQPLAYEPGAKEALAAGGIAVVDLADRVAVEPSKLAVNREQSLEGLSWSGWGAPETTGHGDVSTLKCEPNCATGTRAISPATIVLSQPKRCGDRRFYTRSSMTYEDPDTGKTRAPATYLRTPPC
jgi:hypothetical protein